MARTMYRVCRARHARLDGEGARLAGGRWNSPGRAVVYMAESVALAVLENLVHMSPQDFPTGYVSIAAVLPDGLNIAAEQDLRLRADLRELSSQDLGDWWIDSKKSAVLEVPSAVVTGEHNYLLNPAHPDFARIVADPPALFHFGPRLFRQV
jgi:RES domain-containing protein